GRGVSAGGEGTVSNDAAGVLMVRFVDCFGDYERALIAARTRAALAAKRRRGERVSRFAPFGFEIASDGRMLEPNASEQSTLGLIRASREQGHSLRAIAADLNARGLRTRSGAPWRFEYVGAILRRFNSVHSSMRH